MAGSLQYIAPELVLVAFALAAGLGSAFLQNKRWFGLMAFGGVVGAAFLLKTSTQVPQSLFSGMLVNDGISFFFRVVILGLAGLVILISTNYSHIDEDSRGEYYFFILAMTVSMLLAVSSKNLVMIYLALETVSLISYLLAGYLKQKIFSSEAGIKYFLFGAFSTAVTLYGISLIYGLCGTLDLTLLHDRVGPQMAVQPVFILALIMVLVGFGFKCSLVPFHMWTPDVYQGAPTPVAAFFSVAPKAMGFAFLLRVFVESLGGQVGPWPAIATLLAVVTMTIGNITALSQSNIKRLLAYSTIAQAGYILVGLAVMTPTGIKAMLFYILIYGLMNLGAFACVLAANNITKSDTMESYSGLYKRDSLLAVGLAICLISLAGLPPLAGFMAKFLIIASAVEAGAVGLAVIIVLNSVIALYYYAKIIKFMFLGAAPELSRAPKGLGFSFALLSICIAVCVLGLWPHPVLEWLQSLIPI